MHTQFEDLNIFVYESLRAVALDGVIWCLGPYVDDAREYGLGRRALARLTRVLVRRWYRIRD